MRIETVTKHAVSLRISRSELKSSDALTESDALDAVLQALADSGLTPWDAADIQLFPGKDEILILAKPKKLLPCRFRFDCFHHLVNAVNYVSPDTPSDLLYFNGQYELLLYRSETALPNALYEYGTPLSCSPTLAAHLLEQGERIAARNAVSLIQRHFC